MAQLLTPLQIQASISSSVLSFYQWPPKLELPQHKSYSCYTQTIPVRLKGEYVANHYGSSFNSKANYVDSRQERETLPCIQTLGQFPKEDLVAKVVMVRFDSNVLLRQGPEGSTVSDSKALFSIMYLHKAGAKVVLVSDWKHTSNSEFQSVEFVADYLSSILQIRVVPTRCISLNLLSAKEGPSEKDIILFENLSRFKEEIANSPNFAELLSSRVDIFVNDSFSKSHKILASTVGITRFCSTCIAGFHFEDNLLNLRKIAKPGRKPYVAIIGGDNLCDKALALQFLAARCEGLVFVGMMSFQIMHALGLSVPSKLVDCNSMKEAFEIVQFAHEKNLEILYPKDFLCENKHFQKQLTTLNAEDILDGWLPIDLGPESLDAIGSLLENCQKIIWIGPVKFSNSRRYTNGASKLAEILYHLAPNNIEITVIGRTACEAVRKESTYSSVIDIIENASIIWEFLKGRKLPGVTSLDRAYPYAINWNDAYSNPAQPLVVDIGSGTILFSGCIGNGKFLMEMSRRRKDLNFLGLEINHKLVSRCLHSVQCSGIKNVYFIATNATSTFRSIASTYPGKLVLASIQCPNPDFNKPEFRWRMVQRSLVEAIVDLLVPGGEVFLQSDIEDVAARMKEQFLKFGKDKLRIMHSLGTAPAGWLDENPFGVRSDWEQHVIERGDPMYRLIFSKLKTT